MIMNNTKNPVKYITVGLIIGILLSASFVTAENGYNLSSFPVKLIFNGTEKQVSDKPYQYFNGQTYVPTSLIYEGTTYVPLRFFSESTGQPVKYVSEDKAIYVGDVPADKVQRGYLSDILKPYFIEKNYKIFETNSKMTMGGKEYSKGYKMRNIAYGKEEYTTFSFNLEGKYKRLTGLIGLDDSLNTNKGILKVYGDDKLLKTYDMNAGSLPQQLDVDLTGVIKLDIKFCCIYTNDLTASMIDLVELKVE